jgi:predicted glycosyltransferase involved in capsule biosynthesis
MIKHNISLIVSYRPDTKERVKNLDFFKDYYNRVIPNCEIITVETSDNIFNKCKLYNTGFKKANYNTICFIDSDIFISEKSLEVAYEQAQINQNIVIGYSGDAIYMTYKFKHNLKTGFTYNDLIKDIRPFNTFKVGQSTDMYLVGHTRSVGGCLIMNRKCFEDINGFNPNFKDWGYEDDEIVRRSHLLGKNVVRLGKSQETMLIHLPHHDVERDKSVHNFYKSNQLEYDKVCKMNYNDLQEYIKTWNL